MNNLLLALAVLSATTLTWLHQFTRTHASRTAARDCAARLQTLENALAAERANVATLEAQSTARRKFAREARQALEQASAEAREVLLPADIATDGAWPAARDYFYLPKQYLGSMGYSVFDNDGRLSQESAALFGLTPAEKTGVTDWFRDLRLDLEQLQLQSAERLQPTQPDSKDHREVSFRLPPLTNEMDRLQIRARQDLRNRIGETRAGLIWEKVSQREPLNQANGYAMGAREQIITFSADRQTDGTVRHKLSFRGPESTYHFPIEFDTAPHRALTHDGDESSRTTLSGGTMPLSPGSALGSWRHLFGDQPLLND